MTTTPTLIELINQLEKEIPAATPLEQVGLARLRAATLSDLGDQLVDHFVGQARASGHSWGQIGEVLGVSKQAAQQRPGQGDFSRFTDRSRQVLVLAQEAARANSGAHITSEHILYGVLEVADGVGAQVVAQLLSGSEKDLRQELDRLFPRDTATPPARPSYSEIGRRIIDESIQAALALEHNFVGTEHILLGILRVECPAAALLNRYGVTLDAAPRIISRRIAELVAELTPSED